MLQGFTFEARVGDEVFLATVVRRIGKGQENMFDLTFAHLS